MHWAQHRATLWSPKADVNSSQEKKNPIILRMYYRKKNLHQVNLAGTRVVLQCKYEQGRQTNSTNSVPPDTTPWARAFRLQQCTMGNRPLWNGLLSWGDVLLSSRQLFPSLKHRSICLLHRLGGWTETFQGDTNVCLSLLLLWRLSSRKRSGGWRVTYLVYFKGPWSLECISLVFFLIK